MLHLVANNAKATTAAINMAGGVVVRAMPKGVCEMKGK